MFIFVSLYVLQTSFSIFRMIWMGIIIKGGWENVLLPDDNGPRSCFPKGQHLYTVASLWRPNRGQRSTFSLSGSTQNEDGTSLISSLLICWGCSSSWGCYKVKRIMFFHSVANFDYLQFTEFSFGSGLKRLFVSDLSTF